MSLWCDSILKPVCVLAVNIRRDLFFPLVVTGISLYRYALVFKSGSFSTPFSAAGAVAGAELCARVVAAAAKAGSRRAKSLRERFIRTSWWNFGIELE